MRLGFRLLRLLRMLHVTDKAWKVCVGMMMVVFKWQEKSQGLWLSRSVLWQLYVSDGRVLTVFAFQNFWLKMTKIEFSHANDGLMTQTGMVSWILPVSPWDTVYTKPKSSLLSVCAIADPVWKISSENR